MSFDDGSTFEETLECPICLDELDITDRSFKPCKCGYQMCRFCWNTINENLNGKCPACRQPYNEENFQFIPPNPQDLARHNTAKKAKEREKKQQETTGAKRSLNNVRVIQRNLVYVTNLSLNIAKEEILRRNDYFGRFGKINKIVVNKSNIYNGPQGPSVSAYVTYFREQDSAAAIKSMDGVMVDGRLMRCSFGTTKYCSYFLRNIRCPNPECMYLHELGEEVDSFTKEDMAQGKHLLNAVGEHEDEELRERSLEKRNQSSMLRQSQPSATLSALPPNVMPLGGNPLAQSQPISVPAVKQLPVQPVQPAQPLQPQQPPQMKHAPKPQAPPVWKGSEPVVVPVKEVTPPPTAANMNLNPDDWPDALSVTPKKEKPKHSSAKGSSRDGKDQSILPANASWGTRNNYAFDDEFEDYSAGSSSESDPQQRRKETAVAGSSSGSGNQLEKVGSQQVINQSASTSEGRDEKKSAQPAPSAAAPSNAANNNQRKNQNQQNQKKQTEWRQIQAKPKTEGTSSPEASSNSKEEQKEKETREKQQRDKEQREKEARERDREKEAKEKEIREKEAREREIREKEVKERERMDVDKKEREREEKAKLDAAKAAEAAAFAAAAAVASVPAPSPFPVGNPLNPTISTNPLTGLPMAPPSSQPIAFFSADPNKDNGGFDEWLRVKFTDLLLTDVNTGNLAAPSASAFAMPLALPSSVSMNAPARSRFQFVQDDDASSDLAGGAPGLTPASSLVDGGQDDSQNALRAIFPNVNINFQNKTNGLVMPRAGAPAVGQASAGQNFSAQLLQPRQGVAANTTSSMYLQPQMQQPQQPQQARPASGGWPADGSYNPMGVNSSVAMNGWTPAQQAQQQAQQTQQWNVQYGSQGYPYAGTPDVWRGSMANADQFRGYQMRSMPGSLMPAAQTPGTQAVGSQSALPTASPNLQSTQMMNRPPQQAVSAGIPQQPLQPQQQQQQQQQQAWGMQQQAGMYPQWSGNANFRPMVGMAVQQQQQQNKMNSPAVAVAPPPGL